MTTPRRLSLSSLPDWPRFLTREAAAAYVGVSPTVFDDEVRSGVWPAARKRGSKGGLLTWDRSLLDAAADREAGLAGGMPPPSPLVGPEAEQDFRNRFRGKTSRGRTQTHPQTAA